MKRVVITGMGIYSTIGRNLDEVRESLYLGKSGVGFDPVRKEMGYIRLVIKPPVSILAEDTGIYPTIKKSAGGLVWSIHMLVVGILTVAPWMIVAVGAIFIIRKWTRRKPEAK